MGDAPVPDAAAVEYAPVWQTWNLIRQCPTATSASATASATAPEAAHDLRERMQIARIQNRLTPHDLARMVGCDVETLAAFERGEGVVSGDVQARIRAELRL